MRPLISASGSGSVPGPSAGGPHQTHAAAAENTASESTTEQTTREEAFKKGLLAYKKGNKLMSLTRPVLIYLCELKGLPTRMDGRAMIKQEMADRLEELVEHRNAALCLA